MQNNPRLKRRSKSSYCCGITHAVNISKCVIFKANVLLLNFRLWHNWQHFFRRTDGNSEEIINQCSQRHVAIQFWLISMQWIYNTLIINGTDNAIQNKKWRQKIAFIFNVSEVYKYDWKFIITFQHSLHHVHSRFVTASVMSGFIERKRESSDCPVDCTTSSSLPNFFPRIVTLRDPNTW